MPTYTSSQSMVHRDQPATDAVRKVRRYGSVPWRMSDTKAIAVHRRRRAQNRQRSFRVATVAYRKSGYTSGYMISARAKKLYDQAIRMQDEYRLHELLAEKDREIHEIHEWDWVSPSPAKSADVAARFNSLLETWTRETRYSSSLTQMLLHPAYFGMIALGRDALPLMLQQLRKNPRRWFVAVRAVAHEDPAEGIQDVDEAVAAWLEWAAAHGLEIGDD